MQERTLLLSGAVAITILIALYFGISYTFPRTSTLTQNSTQTSLNAHFEHYIVSGNFSVYSSGNKLGSHYAIKILMNDSGFVEGNFTTYNGGVAIYLMTAAQFNATNCANCFLGSGVNFSDSVESGAFWGRVNPSGFIYFAGNNLSGFGGPPENVRGNFSWLVIPGTYYLWLQGAGNSGDTVDALDWTSTISFVNYVVTDNVSSFFTTA